MRRRHRGRRGRTKKDEDDDNGFAAWGGYMEAKKSKLLEQFNNSNSKESEIFNGISISVNGYTNPSSDELKQIMSLHGGVFHHYTSSKTTFIIASNLPDSKIKQLGPNQKIVKPEWIPDCVRAGKLLDYTNYLLYTNHNRKQPKLNFEKLVQSDKNESVEVETAISPDLFSSNEGSEEIITNTTSLIEKQPNHTINANNPKFLSEFYNNSRLHHIATLGATFKQFIYDLRLESKFIFPARQTLKQYISNLSDASRQPLPNNNNNTIIMHIDMDCFFVSVGLRTRPELKGIPVAVIHSKGGQEPSMRSGVDGQLELQAYKQRMQDKLKLKGIESNLECNSMAIRLEGLENQSMSEIASCSYEARKCGVKNGMFMGAALKLCPKLQTIPYDFSGYKEVAYTLYNTIAEYTLNIEAVSCDEMFVDITDLLQETGASVEQWATYIRNLIKTRTNCPCSTGFGSNRLQARMATRTAKPNGQFYLTNDIVQDYMMNVKVGDLPGVGYSTSLKLESFNIKTCGDLQTMSLAKLRLDFGAKIGETLYSHCRGIDDRQLVYEHERKSVSAEVNYGIRFNSTNETETFLRQLAAEVHSRLVEVKMKGKCISLKLMRRSKDAPVETVKFMGHGLCDNITKSVTLTSATSDLDVIIREILSISRKLAIPPSELRGLGIQISRLEKLNKSNLTGNLTKLFNNMTNNNKTSIENAETISNKETTKLTNCENNKKEETIKPKLENIKSGLKNQIGPIKRGRGRTRGRGGKPIERKASSNGDISKFLNIDNKTCNNSAASNSVEQETPTIIEFNEIDLNVFKELPEEIQKELLQYRLQDNKVEIRPNSVISNTETSCSKNETTKNDQVMFSGMDLKQIKVVMHDWVSTENSPELCDIKMLGEYFRQLALDKKIHQLFVMLKFLYSEILFKKCCAWHRSYFQVIDNAQQGMIARYGKKIKVYQDFKCEKKCHIN